MPTIEGPITECPKCGSELWDNRTNKKTPKSPDYRCKKCEEAYWLPKQGAAKPTFAKPAPEPRAPQPAAGTQDDDRVALYFDSFDRVLEKLKAEKLTDLFHGESIAAMIATLFIGRRQ